MSHWFSPGPNFGYTLKEIDGHPWNTLITMKEVLRLEPGSLRFTGQGMESHEKYWKGELPGLFEEGRLPVFVLDTTPKHPHVVESEPRTPFKPFSDLDHSSMD